MAAAFKQARPTTGVIGPELCQDSVKPDGLAHELSFLSLDRNPAANSLIYRVQPDLPLDQRGIIPPARGSQLTDL